MERPVPTRPDGEGTTRGPRTRVGRGSVSLSLSLWGGRDIRGRTTHTPPVGSPAANSDERDRETERPMGSDAASDAVSRRSASGYTGETDGVERDGQAGTLIEHARALVSRYRAGPYCATQVRGTTHATIGGRVPSGYAQASAKAEAVLGGRVVVLGACAPPVCFIALCAGCRCRRPQSDLSCRRRGFCCLRSSVAVRR